MRPQTSLAAALIALGGAGVAFAEGDRSAGGLSSLSGHAIAGGVSVVQSVAGGYEIRFSPISLIVERGIPELVSARMVKIADK